MGKPAKEKNQAPGRGRARGRGRGRGQGRSMIDGGRAGAVRQSARADADAVHIVNADALAECEPSAT